MLTTCLHLIPFLFLIPVLFPNKMTSHCPGETVAYLYFMQHQAILLFLKISVDFATNVKMPCETLKFAQGKNPCCI